VSALRLAATLLVVTLISGCADIPPGLEKEWLRKEAARSNFETCMQLHPRRPVACDAAKAAFDAALTAYRTAAAHQPH